MSDREYIGAIHIHSTFSDGSTPPAEILRIAAEVGLDFAVITDHQRDTCRDKGLVGWHGSLLCLSAPEIGGKGHPHFLMFCPQSIEGLGAMSPDQALRAASQQGAATFVAHPHPAAMRFVKQSPSGWTQLEHSTFSGLEIWSYMHDVCHDIIPWRLHKLPRQHEQLVRGPRVETLALWDRLCLTRRVAGIGALDNHARHVPLVGDLLPHADLFRLHRTHVLCPPLPAGNGTEAEKALTLALAEGKAFVAMDGWADATGFRFRVEGSAVSLGLGQEAPFAGNMTLSVASPQQADLTVIRNGQVYQQRASCDGLDLPLSAPGAYRIEARLSGRPWVFTNPIYLRDGGLRADQNMGLGG